jgi:hypothetical protein
LLKLIQRRQITHFHSAGARRTHIPVDRGILLKLIQT